MVRNIQLNKKIFYLNGDYSWGTISLGLKPVLICVDGGWEIVEDMKDAVTASEMDTLIERF